MNGGKNRNRASFGYTIVEVLLFLAISGFMFVTAAIFINGKQGTAEFRQGVNGTNTQIRTVMNDVINGFYPSASNFQCTTALSGPPTFIAGSTTQGQNLGCVFIGKVLQFGVHGTGNSSDGWTGYKLYSVAGRQYANNSLSQPPTGFNDSLPTVINSSGITESGNLPWGLSVTKVCALPAACGTTPGAIGFFGGFGNFDSSNNLQSGSQSVNIALIPGSKLDDSDEVSNISNLATSGSILASPNILVCFQDNRGRKASITIGGSNGQQLSTSIQMGDTRC